MPLLLSHLTLNTGYIARTGRAEVADEVVTLLLPVLDAGGGAVPGMPGWFLNVIFPIAPSGARLDGAAFFQVADEPGTALARLAEAEGAAAHVALEALGLTWPRTIERLLA